MQFYSELFQLEPAVIEKIVKPKPLSLRSKLNSCTCLHVHLDESLLVPGSTQSVESYLHHARPGLVHLCARDSTIKIYLQDKASQDLES